MEPTIEMGEIHKAWAGQWMKVKPHQSFRASQRIKAAGLEKGGLGAGDGTVALTFNHALVAVASVQEQVVEWNIQGYSGDVLPLTKEGVLSDDAPPDIIEQATIAIRDFYDAMRLPDFRNDEES